MNSGLPVFAYQTLAEIRSQNIPGRLQYLLAACQSLPEGCVLNFDAHRALVSNLIKHGHEFAPSYVPEPGNARDMPFLGKGEDANLIELVGIYNHILRVQMEQLVPELAQRTERVHVLQHEMGRVIIEAEVLRRNIVEHAPPDGRADREVFAARPFVAAERHRAVLDADFNSVVLGKGD